MAGKVYLVGAGPGRADLITVRGRNILAEADVIIYDRLAEGAALENATKDAELVNCESLKAEDGSGASSRQKRINAVIASKAKEGKKTVRLKGGDPGIFGRFTDELESLIKEGIEFEVVPGVTAASAASSFSGIPLTDRRLASSCVFVAGREDPSKKKSRIDWKSIAKEGTAVFYMAARTMKDITGRLIEAGKDKKTPFAVISGAGLPEQKIATGTLETIHGAAGDRGIKPPAVLIVGEVTRMAREFNWFGKNKKILFTGLSGERFFLKGTYFHVPLIRIEPMDDYGEFDEHVKNISDYDWIVFTSRYGVEYFIKRLRAAGHDSRKLAGARIAAIGRSTAGRLEDFGISADLVPEEESSKGLIKEFGKMNMEGKRIFLPRSDIADKGMERSLERMGAEVTASFAYRNVMPENLPDLDPGEFDEIMFTSPSTVRNFKKRYGKVPAGVEVKCIGEVTLKEAKRCALSGA